MRPVNFLVLEDDAALVRLDETGQQGDQRGLAGAGKPDDGNELALFHFQIDIVQHIRPGGIFAIGFGDAGNFQKGHIRLLSDWPRM